MEPQISTHQAARISAPQLAILVLLLLIGTALMVEGFLPMAILALLPVGVGLGLIISCLPHL